MFDNPIGTVLQVMTGRSGDRMALDDLRWATVLPS